MSVLQAVARLVRSARHEGLRQHGQGPARVLEHAAQHAPERGSRGRSGDVRVGAGQVLAGARRHSSRRRSSGRRWRIRMPVFDSLATAAGVEHGAVAHNACSKHLTLPLIQADHDRASAARRQLDADVLRRRARCCSGADANVPAALDAALAKARAAQEAAASDVACVSRCSSAIARSRRSRAARRSSRRIANRNSSARFARAVEFAPGIASGARRERDRITAAALDARAVGRRRTAGATRSSSWRARDARELQLAYTYFSPSALAFARDARRRLSRLPAVRHTGRRARRARRAQADGARVLQARRVAGHHARSARARRSARPRSARRCRAGRRAAREPRGALLRDAYAALEVGRRHRRRRRRPTRAARRSLDTSSSSPATRDTTRCGCARSASIAPSPMLERLRDRRPTIVAGSTWPADEAVLLPAFEALRRGGVRCTTDHRAARADDRSRRAHRRLGEARRARRRATRRCRPARATPTSSSSIASASSVSCTRSPTSRSSAADFTRPACTRCSSRRRSALR